MEPEQTPAPEASLVETHIVEEKGLHLEAVAQDSLVWLNVERPSPQDMEYLGQRYGFHPLDLDDCLSRTQRPKLDEYEEYLFMVFHFPLFNRAARVTTPSQVAIFLGPDYLVTVHNGDLRPLVRLFRDCKTQDELRGELMSKGSAYLLYRILDALVDYCFPILNKIGANIDEVEERVFTQGGRQTVRELSVLRRDILAYRRIVRPQREVILALSRRRHPLLGEEPEVYFGDLGDHMDKLAEALAEYKEIVEGLNDTHNSLSSFQINDVIRVLTIISTVMLPLSVITGVYGMNLKLPLPSFPFVIGIMLLTVVGMLAFFRYKRWI